MILSPPPFLLSQLGRRAGSSPLQQRNPLACSCTRTNEHKRESGLTVEETVKSHSAFIASDFLADLLPSAIGLTIRSSRFGRRSTLVSARRRLTGEAESDRHLTACLTDFTLSSSLRICSPAHFNVEVPTTAATMAASRAARSWLCCDCQQRGALERCRRDRSVLYRGNPPAFRLLIVLFLLIAMPSSQATYSSSVASPPMRRSQVRMGQRRMASQSANTTIKPRQTDRRDSNARG
jgi:hypothetical protein